MASDHEADVQLWEQGDANARSATIDVGRYMSWHAIIADADVAEGAIHTAKIDGWYVLVTRTDEGLFALNDRCTHQASLLSTGRIRRGAIMCPLHGARFEVASGKCIGGAYRDLRLFAVRTISGMIEVELPDHAPSMEDLPVVF
jgi:anthranilate 1,2-dioxygenase ferredoxin component